MHLPNNCPTNEEVLYTYFLKIRHNKTIEHSNLNETKTTLLISFNCCILYSLSKTKPYLSSLWLFHGCAAVSAKVLFAGRPTFNSCFIALTHAYYVTPLFLWIKTFLAIRMPNMKSAFYKGYKSFRTSYAIFLNVIYDSMALLNLPRELYLYNCIYLIFFFEHSLRMLNNTLFNFMYILSLPRRHVLKQTQL